MQIKVFTISVFGDERQNEEMNSFLRGNKIINIDKHFISGESASYWTFCVTYLPSSSPQSDIHESKERVDYKTVLGESLFQRFMTLRTARKQLAEEEAVPVYAVFTNAELAELSKLEILDSTSLLKVEGIGQKRIEKYGKRLCCLFNNLMINET